MSNFSDRLIHIRQAKNIRQVDAAKAANVTVRAYQYYEKAEKEPTLSVLIALADYFAVSIDYLVGRSDCPDLCTFDKDGKIVIIECMVPPTKKD